MNKDMLLGLVRHLLTTLGGALVAKGVLDSDDAGQLAGALATIVGVVWSVWLKRSSSSAQPTPASKSNPPVSLLVCVLAVGSMALIGCASFRTEQTDTSNPDGTREIKTITKARTFFDSKSALTQLKASQTDKTQSLGVGSLTQESSGSNATALAESIVRGATQAALQYMAPKP
jgi:hypothetical protein